MSLHPICWQYKLKVQYSIADQLIYSLASAVVYMECEGQKFKSRERYDTSRITKVTLLLSFLYVSSSNPFLMLL